MWKTFVHARLVFVFVWVFFFSFCLFVFLPQTTLALKLRLWMSEKLSAVQVVASLDASVKAAKISPGAVVLLVRVPAGVALVRTLV